MMKTGFISGILILMLTTSAFAGIVTTASTPVQVTKLQTGVAENFSSNLFYRRHYIRYREGRYRRPHRRNSKLRTALTIAALAAVGAGIGALAGGGKGAAAGALIGGGGGALYHLFRTRSRH